MGAFDGSIGAFVVGTVLSTFLLGITSCQVFEYFNNFPNDRKLYRWLVGCLCVLDWTHSAVSVYTIYFWTVTHFGEVEYLVESPWSFAIDPAMTGIVSFVCQLFYAYRCYIVSKRKIAVPIVIVCLATISLAFAIGSTAQIFILKEFAKFQSFTYGVSIWLSVAALSDVVITTSLVYHLAQSKTGLLQTNSILNRLIELIISTNGLTMTFAIVDAILFGASSTSWHVAVNLCLIKLYFNSLLVSLNARIELERRLIQSSGHADSHQLNELTTGGAPFSQSRAAGAVGLKSKPDVRTALGFGAGDCSPEIVYSSREPGGRSTGGIRVTTHQSVVADNGLHSSTYLPPDNDKELPYYSSPEKEEEATRGTTPVRSAHFASDIDYLPGAGMRSGGSV